MENKKFSVGDKVKFDDGEKKGVGIIVTDGGGGYSSYLVNSKDILNGHDGLLMSYIQNNENNWWFKEEQLLQFDEKEENNEEIDYKKALLSYRIKLSLETYGLEEWKIYKGFIAASQDYHNVKLFDFLDELKSLGYTIQEIIEEYKKQKGNNNENE